MQHNVSEEVKLQLFKAIANAEATNRDKIALEIRDFLIASNIDRRTYKPLYSEFRNLVISGLMPQDIILILESNGKIDNYKRKRVMSPINLLPSGERKACLAKAKKSSKKAKDKIQNKNSNSKLKLKIENEKLDTGVSEGANKRGKALSIDNIVKDLQKHKHIDELVGIYQVAPKDITSFLEGLKKEGYNISQIGDNYKIVKEIIPILNIHQNFDWSGSKVIKFGVVSDTHLCSKHQQITFLNHLYDLFEQEGIDTVYHAGDLTDGYNKRRSEHIYDLFRIGADEQADYVIEKYPYRPNIKTKFITGNHDAWHTSNGGVDIGRKIAKERADMNYLGCLNAIVYLTPNCKMELNHPLDGASYALSYSIQKYIDSMSGGDKPNILLNGHHHKYMYLFYRNIHALECGTIEAQSAWMKGKRIAAHIGGCIVTLHVDKDGTITRFMPEFIPLYKTKKDDF